MFLFRLFKLWSKTQNIWKSLRRVRVGLVIISVTKNYNSTGGVQITTVCIFPVCSWQHQQGRRIPSGSPRSCQEDQWPWTCRGSEGLRGSDRGDSPVFVSHTRLGRTIRTTSAEQWTGSDQAGQAPDRGSPRTWCRPGTSRGCRRCPLYSRLECFCHSTEIFSKYFQNIFVKTFPYVRVLLA